MHCQKSLLLITWKNLEIWHRESDFVGLWARSLKPITRGCPRKPGTSGTANHIRDISSSPNSWVQESLSHKFLSQNSQGKCIMRRPRLSYLVYTLVLSLFTVPHDICCQSIQEQLHLQVFRRNNCACWSNTYDFIRRHK